MTYSSSFFRIEQALYHSFSPASASATRVRWNILSSTAQYLSARQTMMASPAGGHMAEGQGPHMARDDVLLLLGDGEAALCVDAGRAGVSEAMHLEQTAQAVEGAALVPVVEVEIVEEGPHGQRCLVRTQMEAAVEPEAHQHHVLAVLVGGHIAVLDKLPASAAPRGAGRIASGWRQGAGAPDQKAALKSFLSFHHKRLSPWESWRVSA